MNIKILTKIILSLILIVTIFTMTNINKVEAISLKNFNLNSLKSTVKSLGTTVKVITNRIDKEKSIGESVNGIITKVKDFKVSSDEGILSKVFDGIKSKISTVGIKTNDSEDENSKKIKDIGSGISNIPVLGQVIKLGSQIVNSAIGFLGQGDFLVAKNVKNDEYVNNIKNMYEKFIKDPLNGGLNPKNLCTWWCCSRAQEYLSENSDELKTNPFTISLIPASWTVTARAAGYTVDEKPSPNSIIVYNPNQGYAGIAGHVAYIEKDLGNGRYLISEGNTTNGGVKRYGCALREVDLTTGKYNQYSGIIHLDPNY